MARPGSVTVIGKHGRGSKRVVTKSIVETKQRIEKPATIAGFVEMLLLPCFADTTDDDRYPFVRLAVTQCSRIFEKSAVCLSPR